MEGTYPLPEAQLDRFIFKLRVRYPALEELTEIIDRTTRPREVEVRRVMTGPQVLAFRELVREVPLASHVRELASLHRAGQPSRSGSGRRRRRGGSSATAPARAAPRPSCSAPRCARWPRAATT